MKLPISCSECWKDESRRKPEAALVDVRDDGRYTFTCKRGHKTVTILQQLRFELLFEIGIHAIRDGYYREAVTSFASALERFYEFVIRASLECYENDDSVARKMWKDISNQSERQVGAFVAVYVRDFCKAPVLLDSNQVRYRNSVVHKGKIPTKEEAIEFGQDVFDIIRPMMREAKEKYGDSVDRVISQQIIGSIRRDEGDKETTTASLGTFVSLMVVDDGRREESLSEYLEEI